jgi:hypothetical protein
MSMPIPRCFPLLALLAFGTACGDPDPERTWLARAAGHELSVAETAALLRAADSLPADARQAALSAANLWVDYVLLATAVSEDSTLSQLDLEPLVDQQMEQAAQMALRDSLARAVGTLSAAEVDRRYRTEAEGSDVRVSQILLRVAPEAPAPRHDSARQALTELRTRIVEGGESFEALAREHSQHQESAQMGGDLGFLGPGEMVEPLEEVVFGLEPGEVSEPIETAYGYHLVRLEERRTPSRETFGQRLERQRMIQAASDYLGELRGRADPEVVRGADQLVRRLAGAMPPDSAVPDDTLVRYEAGAITTHEVLTFLRRQPTQVRSRIVEAQTEEISDAVLLPLVSQELVKREAERQGLAPREADRQTFATQIRERLIALARELELREPSGEAGGRGVDGTVQARLREIVGNEREVVPLGPLAQPLHARYPVEVREDRTLLVERQLEETGQERSAPRTEPMG